MPSSSRAALKRAVKPASKPAAKPRARSDIGALPEWNLADLYPALDAPRSGDLESEADCLTFEHIQGLATLAGASDAGRVSQRRSSASARWCWVD
jgi:oligoendopeptidase F